MLQEEYSEQHQLSWDQIKCKKNERGDADVPLSCQTLFDILTKIGGGQFLMHRLDFKWFKTFFCGA